MAEPFQCPLNSDTAGASDVSPPLPANVEIELRQVERLIRSSRIQEFVLNLKKQFFGYPVSDDMLVYHFTLWAQQFGYDLSTGAVRCSPLWSTLAERVQTARKEAYNKFRSECDENYQSMFTQE